MIDSRSCGRSSAVVVQPLFASTEQFSCLFSPENPLPPWCSPIGDAKGKFCGAQVVLRSVKEEDMEAKAVKMLDEKLYCREGYVSRHADQCRVGQS